MHKIVLITGANGFLGAEIVRQLRDTGHSVRATGQNPSYFRSDVEYIQADITQPDRLSEITTGVSSVIHTAGLAHIFHHSKDISERFFQINELGTKNMALAAIAAGVKHFILISSVSVYGPSTQGLCTEDNACYPEGPYAWSKLNAERQLIALAKETGMAVTCLRLATLYGEGDPGNVGRLMRSLDQGRFIWIGDGYNRKSLLYRGDAVRACLAVLNKPPSRGVAIYNVSAPPCTMREIVDRLATELDKKLPSIRVPAATAVQVSRLISHLRIAYLSRFRTTIDKWLAEDIYDTRRIEQEIGFFPAITLNEGLRREVCWYREQQKKTG